MKYTNYSVNGIGMEEIRNFLIDNHKHSEIFEMSPCGGYAADRLNAWAADAEFSMSEGNGATIGLSQFDSADGMTDTFTISPAGLDAEEIEIDE